MPQTTEIRETLIDTMDSVLNHEITPEQVEEIIKGSEKKLEEISQNTPNAAKVPQTNKQNTPNIRTRGKRKVNALNNQEIKTAKPKEKAYKLTDGEGLFLLVSTSGGKLWRFKYRFDGKEKTVSIGAYPAITLARAREIKNEMRAKVASGISPADEKKVIKQEKAVAEVKKIFTFEKLASELLEEWLSEDTGGKTISQSTYNRNYLYLNKDAYPVIGNMPVEEITTNNIKTVIMRVVDRNSHESARKLFYLLSKIFKTLVSRNNADNPRYAYGIEFNPCKLIEISDIVGEPSKKNYPTITDPEEIKALLLSIDGYKGDISTMRALQLMPYTALRPGNVRLAEWSEFNLLKKTWTIKASKMKTKNDFVLPLTDQMIDILAEMEPLSGDGRYVFPSPSNKGRALSDNTLNGALRRLGYSKEDFTAHGFRAMFSTIVNNETDFKHEIIEACLAHAVGNEVSRKYNRADYLEQRREVMQWWADHLDGIKASK